MVNEIDEQGEQLEQDGLRPDTVVRPDGRVYRARKLPVAVMASGDSGPFDYDAVIVLRTHDLPRARRLANIAWRQFVGNDDLADMPDFTRGWFRVVPWDASGGGYDSSWVETGPQDRRSTPGIMFMMIYPNE